MREDWIDRWKGFLICLVVLGHAVGTASHFAKEPVRSIYEGVFKVIYCFHMPAFFCLAGYVWKAKNDGFLVFCRKKFERLVVPFFIFAVISAIVYYLASGAIGSSIGNATDDFYSRKDALPNVASLLLSIVHAGGLPKNGVFVGNSVLWFLPVMFMTCVAYWFVDCFLKCIWGQLLLGFASLVSSHFVPENLPWGLTLVPFYLPFVIVGRWVLPKLVAFCEKRWKFILPIAFFAYLYFCLISPNRWFLGQSLCWRLLFGWLAFLGTFVGALFMKKVKLPWMANAGVASLGIMLIHKYVILAVGMKSHVVRNLYGYGFGLSFFMVSIVTLVAIFVSYWLTKFIDHFCPWVFRMRKS